jgi:hypothetical protein
MGIFVISFATIFYFYFFENSDNKGAVTDFLAIIEVQNDYSDKANIEAIEENSNKNSTLPEGDRLFISTIKDIHNMIKDSKVYSGKAVILGVNSQKSYIYPHMIDGGTYIRTDVGKDAMNELSQFVKSLFSSDYPGLDPKNRKQIYAELNNKISMEAGILVSSPLEKDERKILRQFSSEILDSYEIQARKINTGNMEFKVRFEGLRIFEDMLEQSLAKKAVGDQQRIQKQVYQKLSKKIRVTGYSVTYHRPLTRAGYDELEKHCKGCLAAYDSRLFDKFKAAVLGTNDAGTEKREIWDVTYRALQKVAFKKDRNNKPVSSVEAIADYLEHNISVKQTHFYLANSFQSAEPPPEVVEKFANVISKNPDNYFHFIVLPQGQIQSTQGTNFLKLYEHIVGINEASYKKYGNPKIELRRVNVQRNFLYQSSINSILEELTRDPELANSVGDELKLVFGDEKEAISGKKKIFDILFKTKNKKYIPNDLQTIFTEKFLKKDFLKVILNNGGNYFTQGKLIKRLLLDKNFKDQRMEIIELVKRELNQNKESNWGTAIKLLVLMEQEDYEKYAERFYRYKVFKEQQDNIEFFRRNPSSSMKGTIYSFGLKDAKLEAGAIQVLVALFNNMGYNYSIPEEMLTVFRTKLKGEPIDPFLANVVLSWLDEDNYLDILSQLQILNSEDYKAKKKFLDVVLEETSVVEPNNQLRFKAIPLGLNKRFYANLAEKAFLPVYPQYTNLNKREKKTYQDIKQTDELLKNIAIFSNVYDKDYPNSKNIVTAPGDNPSIVQHIIDQIFHKDFRYTPSAIMAGLCILMAIFSIFYLRVSSNLVTGYKKEAKYIFFIEVLITSAVLWAIYSILSKGQYLISPKLAIDDPLFNTLKYIFYALTGIVIFLLFSPFISNYKTQGYQAYFFKLKFYSLIKAVSLLLPYLVAILVVMVPSTKHGLTFANLPKPYAIYFMGGLFVLYFALFWLHSLYEQDAASYKSGLSALNNKVKEFVDQTVDYRKDDLDDPTTMLVRAKGFDFKEFIPVDINQGLKDISLSASLKHGAFMYPLGYSALQGKLLKKDFDLEQMGDMIFVSFISDDLINSRLSCISKAELRQKTGAYMVKTWLELVRAVYSKWTFSAFFPRTNKLLDYYILGDIGDVQEYFNNEIMATISKKSSLPYLKRQVEKILNRIPLDMDIVMLTDTYFANDCRELIARFIRGTKRMGILINIEDEYKTARRIFDYYGTYPDLFPEGWRLTTYKKSLSNLLEVTTSLPTSLNVNFRTPLQNSLRQLIKKNETQI